MELYFLVTKNDQQTLMSFAGVDKESISKDLKAKFDIVEEISAKDYFSRMAELS